jgi:TRAP-type C4-dicarboxylate transport system permease small subunit
MSMQKIAGILLIVAGALGLAYGGFSFTKKTHEANIGSLNLSVDEKKYVSVPTSIGIGCIVMGGLLLMVRIKN